MLVLIWLALIAYTTIPFDKPIAIPWYVWGLVALVTIAVLDFSNTYGQTRQ